jgi:hypothetical protein
MRLQFLKVLGNCTLFYRSVNCFLSKVPMTTWPLNLKLVGQVEFNRVYLYTTFQVFEVIALLLNAKFNVLLLHVTMTFILDLLTCKWVWQADHHNKYNVSSSYVNTPFNWIANLIIITTCSSDLDIVSFEMKVVEAATNV